MIAAFLIAMFAMLPAGPVETMLGGDPQIHKGTVVSAGGGQLVMKDSGGKEHSYPVDSVTKVTVNGKPGRLEDLQETMPVQVTTDDKGKVLAVSTMDKDKQPVLVFQLVKPMGRLASNDFYKSIGLFGTN